MKNAFRIKLIQPNEKRQKIFKVIPNSKLNRGIIFDGEKDAHPRTVSFLLWGRSAATKNQLYKLDLKLSVRDNNLHFEARKNGSLPAGRYWFSLYIEDLRFQERRCKLDITNGLEEEVKVEIKKADRAIQLRGPLAQMDDQMRHILMGSSRIDDKRADWWLRDSTRRAKRRACLLNILAKIRNTPRMDDSLISCIRKIFFADVDRIYTVVDASLIDRLRKLAKDPGKPFYREGTPKHKSHKRILCEGEKRKIMKKKGYRQYSYRQEGQPTLQIIVACPPAQPAGQPFLAELDIDWGNPLQDVTGFFIHLGELIVPGKTDHLKLWKKLRKEKLRFTNHKTNKTLDSLLFYDVVKET